MATNLRWLTVASSGTGPYEIATWVDLQSQNITNRTSTVIQYVGWRRTTSVGYGSWDGSATWAMTCGGNVANGGWSLDAPAGGAVGWQIVASRTYTLQHNAQGVLNNVTLNGSLTTGTSGFGNGSPSGTFNLPTISTASTPSFTNPLTAGVATTINTNRQDPAYVHNMEWRFGDGANSSGTIGIDVGASVSWTPPLSMLNKIPNATSGVGSIRTITKLGPTQIGSETRVPFTLNAPASVVPTCSAVLAQEQNPLVANLSLTNGHFLQGLSQVKLTPTGAGVYGSTIVTAKTVTPTGDVPSGGIVALTQSGTVNVTGHVTDTRGRVGTLPVALTVLPYTSPQVVTCTVVRANSSGAPLDEGTYLRVNLQSTVQSINSGGQKNTARVKVRTRPYNPDSPQPWTNRNDTSIALAYNSNFLVTGGGIYTDTQSWEVEVTVVDALGNAFAATAVRTVTTTQVTLDLNGIKVGVGKIHELGALDVAGDIYANGKIVTPAATQAQANAGTANDVAITPATLKALNGLGIHRTLGRAIGTASQTGITTATTITGLSVAFTTPTPVMVEPRLYVRTRSTNASDVVAIRLLRNGTRVMDWIAPANASPTASGTSRTQTLFTSFEIPAGSHTFTVQALRATGTGTITVEPDAGEPATLTITQIS